MLIYQVLLSLVTACACSMTMLFTCTDRPASTSSVVQQDRTDGDSLPSDEQLVEQEITGKRLTKRKYIIGYFVVLLVSLSILISTKVIKNYVNVRDTVYLIQGYLCDSFQFAEHGCGSPWLQGNTAPYHKEDC